MVTGTSIPSVRLQSAGASPDSSRMAGKMPWAISRSSASAAAARSIAASSIAACCASVVSARARRSSKVTASNRCCAPSCRSRSIWRRVSSAALTMRPRTARSEVSWSSTSAISRSLSMASRAAGPIWSPSFRSSSSARIVGDHRDRTPAADDCRAGPPLALVRNDGFTGCVNESCRVRQPVGHRQALVPERSGQHRLERTDRGRRGQVVGQPRHRRSTSSLPQHHRNEPDGDQRQAQSLQVEHGQKDRPRGILGRVDQQCRGSGCPGQIRQARRDEHRPADGPRHRRRRRETCEGDGRGTGPSDDDGRAPSGLQPAGDRRVGQGGEHVVRAVVPAIRIEEGVTGDREADGGDRCHRVPDDHGNASRAIDDPPGRCRQRQVQQNGYEKAGQDHCRRCASAAVRSPSRSRRARASRHRPRRPTVRARRLSSRR